jgi:hypothetical protein
MRDDNQERRLPDNALLPGPTSSATGVELLYEAVEADNSLLYSKEITPEFADEIIRNRQQSLETLYPKVTQAQAPANKIKICVIFDTPGPWFAHCVESVLYQDYPNFDVIFVDNGSNDGSHARVPQGDSRVTLIRNATKRSWNACLRQCLARQCAPGDIIFPLDGASRLAYCDALMTVNDFFNSYECALMYGQYKFVSGQLGWTIPIVNPETSSALKAAGFAPLPVIFRRRLFDELGAKTGAAGESDQPALSHALLAQAGLTRARFSDHILMVIKSDS